MGNVVAGTAQFTASLPSSPATPGAAEVAAPCVMACFTAALSGKKGSCGSSEWTSFWRMVPARSRTESSFSDSCTCVFFVGGGGGEAKGEEMGASFSQVYSVTEPSNFVTEQLRVVTTVMIEGTKATWSHK